MSRWFDLADSALGAAVQIEAVRNQQSATAAGQQATVETVQREQVVREVTNSNLEGSNQKLLLIGGAILAGVLIFAVLKK